MLDPVVEPFGHIRRVIEPFGHIGRVYYLSRHRDEHPFPLNGTDWARLVNERLERQRHPCLCSKCFNLLTRLHSKETPLRRERHGVQRAMHYWFLQGTPRYREFGENEDAFNPNEQFYEPVRIPEQLGGSDFASESLKMAEMKWLKDSVQVSKVNLVEGCKSTQAIENPEMEIPVAAKPGRKVQSEKKDAQFWEADSCDFYESRPQDFARQHRAEPKEK